MDVEKIAKIAVIARQIAALALPLSGGYKALAALFGHELSEAEQQAITVAVRADAIRRLDEGERMAAPSLGGGQ
jgi:hypothetical protein